MSTRRNFLKTLSGMALLTVVPRHVLGGPKHVAPSDQLTKGIIGVGGIGKSSYHFTSTDACRLVAVCDVDRNHLDSAVALGRTPFGSPTLSDQALMPFPSMKMGPGKSSRSHTADEFIFVREIEEAIGLFLELLDGAEL